MKKILKVLIVFFALIITVTIVNAKPVNQKTALAVANNFFRIEVKKSSDNVVLNYLAINSKLKINTVLLHVYYGDKGFIIISGDDNTYPVLAYSDNEVFSVSNDNESYNWWMNKVTEAIEEASASKAEVSSEIRNAWDLYTSENKSGGSSSNTKSVSPLVNTTWDQGQNYNASCPTHQMGPGGRCYAGCVATAMAQIMKRYNYPTKGQGSHSYSHPSYGTITANFDTIYDWQYMTPPSIANSTHPDAIARLIYACGISVDMYYTPSGSSAIMSDALNALYYDFKYRKYIKYIAHSAYTDEQWRTYLMDNLDMGYPVLYGGQDPTAGGHAWVCDGYTGNNYFHFNWGWSGYHNGYYYLNNLNSGNGNFTSGQDAIINIVADTSIYPLCIPNKHYAAQSWTFDNGSGISTNYANNTNCQWLIKPDIGDYLQINFTRFKTELNKDFVTIYDGETTSSPILGVYSGNNIPPSIITSSAKALVVFTTDNANTYTGWKIKYTTLYNCKPHTIFVQTIIDTVFDNGSGYNFNYANNTNCQWLVKVKPSKRIQLAFQRFSTEPLKDFLTIYDGDTTTAPILGSYSGTNLPNDIYSSSNKILLVFVTDNINTSLGWQVIASILDSTSTLNIKENNIIKSLKMYPNPAHDKLNLSGDFINDGLTKFSIYNIQSVKQYADESYFKAGYATKSIDVSNLSAGIYILKIENANANYYLKFIIQ